MKKQLVIINGVTGAIGGASLAVFSREPNTVMYGLSRKAADLDVMTEGKYLSQSHIVVSIGERISDVNAIHALLNKINWGAFDKVTYIHAVGVYPFEINDRGKIEVMNDDDGDNIDDRVTDLSYQAFTTFVSKLSEYAKGKEISAVIFSGLSDEHRPQVHQSWWKTMDKIREFGRAHVAKNHNVSVSILKISSVICPHEILTRPFVFSRTNANAQYWLTPEEVAQETLKLTKLNPGFYDKEIFHKSDYYEDGYYSDAKLTKRKIKELGIKV